ncbi:aminoglycoside phosphotransferase family protein [Actinomadura parmotrematis]|uniref:Aminoglycoside phosphotransferase family protein n=1 Tax=Actinomadura parmotrematis TaxID=2864039 RepID=A0ABS7FTP7_9ACTN|nr:aminoglycoside phosphotransferase family protein [Actinomadura parmotrematis]MBW8483784.1 aminoglycoside phosphotransferase family protein [Actinomadura parmotrematis]
MKNAIETGPHTVTKRFPEGDRDRCEREWRALTLLAAHAPGLAPEPLELDAGAARPLIVMSRLPGVPLRGRPLDARQVAALATAVRQVHAAVPPNVLADVPERPGRPAELAAWIRTRAVPHVRPRVSGEVAGAVDAGLAWLDGADLDADAAPAFGPGDGNLANYLWDGTRVRVVDFEESGRSDRAFELAEITEHAAAWVEHPLEVAAFLGHCDLTAAEGVRLCACRRLLAFVWLLMLAADGAPGARNPPGTAERQAGRLAALLG